MNLYLMIAIVIANAIAIGIVYQFIKKLENKQKIIIIGISVAIMYVLTSITYWISGFGIDETIHEGTKDFITYLFVPINMILFVPYVLSKYMKLRAKQIKKEEFLKKLMIIIVLLIIVLVVEYFYFKNVQNNINVIGDNIEQTNTVNQNAIANEALTNETVSNEIEQNIIQNEIMTNEMSNAIVD